METTHTTDQGYRYEAKRLARLSGGGGIKARKVEFWQVKVFTTAGAVADVEELVDLAEILNFETVLGISNSQQVGPAVVSYGLANFANPYVEQNPSTGFSSSKIIIPATTLSGVATHYLEIIVFGTVKK